MENDKTIQSPIMSLLRQKALLQTEYDEEKENFKRQMQAMGLPRRIRRGDAWHPVRIGRSYYNSLNQLAIEVYRTADDDIEHNFEFGKPVCFFHTDEAAGNGATADKLPTGKTQAKGTAKAFDLIATGTVSYADTDKKKVPFYESLRNVV